MTQSEKMLVESIKKAQRIIEDKNNRGSLREMGFTVFDLGALSVAITQYAEALKTGALHIDADQNIPADYSPENYQ